MAMQRSAGRVGSGNHSQPRIFVQIPAYRDPELGPTLVDLFAKAHDPELLRVLVLWQRAEDESLPLCLRRLPNLEIIERRYQESQGCNWARNTMQKQWQGERYTLLLDSHHRFVKDWDRKTVEIYEGLIKKGVRRPLVTAYLPKYVPAIDPCRRGRQPLKLYPRERKEGLLVGLIAYPIPDWKGLRGPIGADFVSLHFLFADGEFNRDIPFDPVCYFVGDEVATSLRTFTGGYDIFHPHIVLGWHCYDRAFRRTHWDDHAEWSQQQRRSFQRLRTLFRGQLRDRHGIGRLRSLREYECYLHMKLVEETKRCP